MEYRYARTTYSLAVFDRTDTNDREIIRAEVNTLLALLHKGDYRDYFRAKNGFEAQVAHRVNRRVRLFCRLTAFTYASMPVETQWSLFYPNRTFRPNPQVRPGDAGRLQLGVIVDTRPPSLIFRDGWYLSAVYERGFREFGYDGLVLAAKRYQRVGFGNQGFVIHGRLGTRESTDEQHLFDLGGVGTLRGYDIKEYSGNRMVMVNIDYLFGGDVLGRIPLKGFHLLNLILFFDVGWTSNVSKTRHLLAGFAGLDPTDFKPDVGIAVAAAQQLVRVNAARRLDRRDDAWVFSVRFARKL